MKQSISTEEKPEFLEEVHIKYKSFGKQNHSTYASNEEFLHVSPESFLEDFDRNQIIQRSNK
jgi:hypothetical protein